MTWLYTKLSTKLPAHNGPRVAGVLDQGGVAHLHHLLRGPGLVVDVANLAELLVTVLDLHSYQDDYDPS